MAALVTEAYKDIDYVSIEVSERVCHFCEIDLYCVPVGSLQEIKGDPVFEGLPFVVYGGSESLEYAFLSGAADYLKTPWTAKEFFYRTLKYIYKNVIKTKDGSIWFNHERMVCKDSSVDINHDDYVILKGLLRNKNKPVPRTILVYMLWGRIDKNTRIVDVRISVLRNKISELLGIKTAKDIISTVSHYGYCINVIK